MYVQKNAKIVEYSLMNFYKVHTAVTHNQIKQDITSVPEDPYPTSPSSDCPPEVTTVLICHIA